MHIMTGHIGKTWRQTLIGLAVAVGLVLSWIILSASPAVKAETPSVAALCSATATLNLSPGLRLLQETQGTNQSFGETGTLRCAGKIDGKTITGPGTIGFSSTYRGNCLAITGGGAWFFTLPTNGGSVHRQGTYSGPSIGSVVYFDGSFPGGRMTGAGPVVPVQGSCVPPLPLLPPPAPLTKGTLILTGLQLTQ